MLEARLSSCLTLPVHPDLLLLTGLWKQELGCSFSTGRKSRDPAGIQKLRKTPWHISKFMDGEVFGCLGFCCLKQKENWCLWATWTAIMGKQQGSKSSGFHKCTGYPKHISSKDLIRKLPFIKRASIGYFNHMWGFFLCQDSRAKIWMHIGAKHFVLLSKNPSVFEGIALVEKLLFEKPSEIILWSGAWVIRLSMPADSSPVLNKKRNPSLREMRYF